MSTILLDDHLAGDIYLAEADDNAPLRAAAHAFGVTVQTVRD